MGLFQRLFGKPDRGAAPALYAQVVARGREPHWYSHGRVPDSIDGRFDMIAAVLALVLLRLEQDSAGAPISAMLAECFIDDMDDQLREQGVGDVVVGKHIGRMMGMLGGRLGAYRDALAAGEGALRPALVRNVWRGEAPAEAGLAHVEAGLLKFRESLAGTPVAAIVAGELPE